MATKEPDGALVVVLAAFIGRIGDDERIFLEGDLVRATDPAAKKWPNHFKPFKPDTAPRIEQATAAPGEQRG